MGWIRRKFGRYKWAQRIGIKPEEEERMTSKDAGEVAGRIEHKSESITKAKGILGKIERIIKSEHRAAFEEGILNSVFFKAACKQKKIPDNKADRLEAFRKLQRIIFSEKHHDIDLMRNLDSRIQKIESENPNDKEKARAIGALIASAAASVLNKLKLSE